MADRTERITLTLLLPEADALNAAAAATGKSKTYILREALAQWVVRHPLREEATA